MIILFVGFPPGRRDLLKNVAGGATGADSYFLESFRPEEISDPFISTLGKVIFWRDYPDAVAILEALRPEKIVCMHIESYYHIALRLAARHLRIPVVFIDHGIRFANQATLQKQVYEARPYTLTQRIRRSRPGGLLTRLYNRFFAATMKRIDPAVAKQGKKMFLTRATGTPLSLMQKHADGLRPDAIIAYSPETMKAHAAMFQLPAGFTQVTFTGIPSLDPFAPFLAPAAGQGSDKKSLLWIDQPMHEQKILGWTADAKLSFYRNLVRAAQAAGYVLYLKLHPWNKPVHEQLEPEYREAIRVVADLTPELITGISSAGSFNSALLLGFCAMPGVATFCMEVHPVTATPAFAQELTKWGTAALLRSYEELQHLLARPEAFLEEKQARIPAFIQEAAYAMDGHASERITEALLARPAPL